MHWLQARTYQTDEKLTGFSTFAITCDDGMSDKHFSDVLDSLDIDLQGRLVEWMTLDGNSIPQYHWKSLVLTFVLELGDEFSSLWREDIGLWIQALEPNHGCAFYYFIFH